MNVPATPAAPIFILCCNRSGSSLLRYIIDTHPDIASPAELNLGEVCQKLYDLVNHTLGEAVFIDKPEKNALVIAQVRRLVSQVMDKYVNAKNKKIWCEKSPSNLNFLSPLTAVFPDAKYICLHRHAMDVVHSCLEISRWSLMPDQLNYVCQNSGSIVGAMVQNWVEKTRQILDFEQEHPEQCFQVKYESYVLNPVDTLGPMFEFLGVEWDRAMLDSVFSVQHDLGFEDQKVAYSNRIHQNSIGKGAQVNTFYIAPHLMKEMNELLARLEYPIVGPDWGAASYSYLFSDQNDQHISEDNTPSSINTAEVFINSFASRLKDLVEALENRQVIYKINFIGEHNDTWTIDLTKPECPISRGDGEADCTVTFLSKDAINIVNGTLNPIELWIQKKLQVSGDRELADIFCWFLVDRLKWRRSSANWRLECG